tara:strand:+ start:75 stop:233 length:159 start_codon:yes stop_codon:yes gene_type:complete
MNENTVKQALLYLFNKAYEEESKLNEYNNGYASYNQQQCDAARNYLNKLLRG